MLEWLRDHQAMLRNEPIEARYQQLVSQNNVPQLPVAQPQPNSTVARIQRLIAEQAAINSQNAAIAQQAEAKAKASVNQLSQNTAVFMQNATLQLQQQANRVDALAQNLHDPIQRLNGIADQLDNDLTRLQNEIEELNKRNANTQANISEAQREDWKLQQLVYETEREIKERNKNWVNDALKAAAIIAVCLIATKGLSILVAPTKGGGIGVTMIKRW
jgi:chromosome segregation ATPase